MSRFGSGTAARNKHEQLPRECGGPGESENGLDEGAVVEGGPSGPGLLRRQQRGKAAPERLAQHGSDPHPTKMGSAHRRATWFGDTG